MRHHTIILSKQIIALIICLLVFSLMIFSGVDAAVIAAPDNDLELEVDLDGPWTLVLGVPWAERSGHTSVHLPDDSIVLMGGYNGDDYLNDVWSSTDGGETWTQTTDNAAWSPRSGHVSVLLNDGSILLLGGRGSAGRLNDVWRSTDKGATWTQVNGDAAWSARNDFAAVVIPSDGDIILMGGNDDETSYHYYKDDVWQSDDGGSTWSLVVAESEWSDRRSHAAVVLSDDTIIIMGGKTRGHVTSGGEIKSSYDLTLSSVYISTDKGETWSKKDSLPKPVGSHSAVVVEDDAIIVTGGHYYSPFVPVQNYRRDDVYKTDDKAESWTTVNNNTAWTARSGHTSVPLQDWTIVLIGGYTGSQNNDVWRSTDEGVNWVDISGAPWSKRFAHSSVALPGGNIILMAGDDGTRKNDVWLSSNQGETWTLVTAEAEWESRKYHTSVALPDGSIVLMGGQNGYYATDWDNDVWRSSDQGNTWTLMTKDAAWSERGSHTSVVLTDGSILVLGGKQWDAGYLGLNDVWRSTDQGATWTLMTNDAGWEDRFDLTAVALYDGSVVVMGGDDDDNMFNDVWRSTDGGATWSQQTSNAAWEPRGRHTSVVLSDNRIALMGGRNENGDRLNDVWVSSDMGVSWTLLEEHASWSPRMYHSSIVLPGDSILVMGGYGSLYNDVWRLGEGVLYNFLPLIVGNSH